MQNLEKLDFQKYGEFSQFIPVEGMMPLRWGETNRTLGSELQKLETSAKSDFYRCCVSAVWLFQGFLDESHLISQEIHSGEGSYLHGIMHRREGDYSNAKYWFRKSSLNSFFPQIDSWAQSDPEIDDATRHNLIPFDANSLVDAVSQVDAVESQKYGNESLERLTFYELLAVFDHCFDKAIVK